MVELQRPEVEPSSVQRLQLGDGDRSRQVEKEEGTARLGFRAGSFQVAAFRAGEVERVGGGEEVPVVGGAVVI